MTIRCHVARSEDLEMEKGRKRSGFSETASQGTRAIAWKKRFVPFRGEFFARPFSREKEAKNNTDAPDDRRFGSGARLARARFQIPKQIGNCDLQRRLCAQ
jgi:hypothetical protein